MWPASQIALFPSTFQMRLFANPPSVSLTGTGLLLQPRAATVVAETLFVVY